MNGSILNPSRGDSDEAKGAGLLATLPKLSRGQARSRLQIIDRLIVRIPARRPSFRLRLWIIAATFGIGSTLLLVGCADSTQQKAYERAAHLEHNFTAESASAIIAEYQQVIALEPSSTWAKQARRRIESVEARLNAEDLHISVFQEHGVD